MGTDGEVLQSVVGFGETQNFILLSLVRVCGCVIRGEGGETITV